MENASKALIMAGGILIAILLITLLIYAWSLFSDYQSSRDSLAEIQDTAKFNLQFTNYDRDDVLGYELLSLLNKIIDYNERRTTQTLSGNDDKYPPISITIKIGDENIRKKFTYNDTIQLFTNSTYTDNELTVITTGAGGGRVRTSFKQNVEDRIKDIKRDLDLNETDLTSMAKNIRTLFKTAAEISTEAGLGTYSEDDVKKIMVNSFNSYMKEHKLGQSEEYYNMLILKDNKKEPNTVVMKTIDGKEYTNLYNTLCAYYEYMQFKRGIFRCEELKYDENNTGRVISVTFTFTGKIK